MDDETNWGDGEEVDQVMHKPVRLMKTINRVVFDMTGKKIIWELGMVFWTAEEFGVAVTTYAIQEHFQIEKYVNAPSRVRIIYCKEGFSVHVRIELVNISLLKHTTLSINGWYQFITTCASLWFWPPNKKNE